MDIIMWTVLEIRKISPLWWRRLRPCIMSPRRGCRMLMASMRGIVQNQENLIIIEILVTSLLTSSPLLLRTIQINPYSKTPLFDSPQPRPQPLTPQSTTTSCPKPQPHQRNKNSPKDRTKSNPGPEPTPKTKNIPSTECNKSPESTTLLTMPNDEYWSFRTTTRLNKFRSVSRIGRRSSRRGNNSWEASARTISSIVEISTPKLSNPPPTSETHRLIINGLVKSPKPLLRTLINKKCPGPMLKNRSKGFQWRLDSSRTGKRSWTFLIKVLNIQ